jgi:hypothetical protein
MEQPVVWQAMNEQPVVCQAMNEPTVFYVYVLFSFCIRLHIAVNLRKKFILHTISLRGANI